MPLITLMQFSDLHKRVSPEGGSSALISSIVSDLGRHSQEDEPISRPDILVVCGDIIRGAESFGSFEKSVLEVEQQYYEANVFLSKLCNEIFNGDKNKIVLVPGNHDVSWPHSIQSMEKIHISQGHRYAQFLNQPESNIRWSWNDMSFFKIADSSLYKQRLLPFSKFYSTFYNSKRKYLLDPDQQHDIFEFPEYKIIIAGLNSCFRNDHLNNIGMIHPDCMAKCHSYVNEEKYKDWLKIAVWHHGIHGVPGKSDFMSPGAVQFLIDKGFQIGMYGHKHQGDIFEVKFCADQSRKMLLVGCGTLCASQQDIPLGETRQYNLIEIGHPLMIKIHLRKTAEQPDGLPIWMAGNIKQNQDRSYIEFPLKTLLSFNKHKKGETDVSQEPGLFETLEEAQDLISQRDFKAALKRLKTLKQENAFVRRLTIECLFNLELDDDIIEYIDVPRNVLEFTYTAEALWRKRRFVDLKNLINKLRENEDIADSPTFKRMESKLADRGV